MSVALFKHKVDKFIPVVPSNVVFGFISLQSELNLIISISLQRLLAFIHGKLVVRANYYGYYNGY